NEFQEPLHFMVPETRIIVRITFRANRTLSRPAAGFLLRNHLGLEFAETSTDREGRRLLAMRAGEISTVDFHVEIPELYPATLSFSPFVTDGSVCDWVDNATTVQMARGDGPVYGYVQLPCKVELSTPSAVRESPLA